MTDSVVSTNHRNVWKWPGPFYLYEFLIVVAIYFPLLHFYGKSGFAMAVFAALIVCASLLQAALGTEMSAKDWGTFNRYSIWVIRAVAVGVGYWLFVDTQTIIVRSSAVLIYVVLYIVCEIAAWRRKRIVEKAAAL